MCQTVRENVRYENSSRHYENSRLIIEATELKAQEEETRLPAQTFIPSALSRCEIYQTIKMQIISNKIGEVCHILA